MTESPSSSLPSWRTVNLPAGNDRYRMVNSVSHRLVRVPVPFEVSFVERHGRIVRTETVAEMANVLLRAPEKGEARVAFRIYTIDPAERKYPKIDTREVVHCDGAMWWQVGLSA